MPKLGGSHKSHSSTPSPKIYYGTVTLGPTETSKPFTLPGGASVDMSRTILKHKGAQYTIAGTGSAQAAESRIELSNPTTVTVTRGSVGGGDTLVVKFEVHEFPAGAFAQSVQRGTISIAGGATSGTASITSASTAKCL